MNNNPGQDPLYESNLEFQGLRLRLKQMPPRTAPDDFILKLQNDFSGGTNPPASFSFKNWLADLFTWSQIWKPVSVLTAAVFLAALWFFKHPTQQEVAIDLGPLLAAHQRSEADTMLARDNVPSLSNGGMLAVYYEDNR